VKLDLLLEVLEESLRRTNEQFRKAMERKWALHDELRKVDAEIRRLEDRRDFFSEAVRRLQNENPPARGAGGGN